MAIEWDKALEAIVNISADAIISTDENQCILKFNKGAEEIFGWTSEEIIGKHVDVLIPERFRAGHPEQVRRFGESQVQARRMGERREISGLRRNGEEFPAEASISKIDTNGERIYTVVMRDVTDRKRREEALERAVAARDDVLSFVSHDLGNPLAAIRIASAVLLKQQPDEPHILGIREAVEQAQRLIRDLLDVQKLEAGKTRLDIERLSIADVVDETIRTHLPVAEEKQISLQQDMPADLPRVAADRDRMAQVFANLLSNAIKFSPANSAIVVSATADATDVVVRVKDVGAGIPQEHLPYIFDRYWQALNGRVGHGIGLAIVQAIVRAHQGRVWAESTFGQGSTFFVALPKA